MTQAHKHTKCIAAFALISMSVTATIQAAVIQWADADTTPCKYPGVSADAGIDAYKQSRSDYIKKFSSLEGYNTLEVRLGDNWNYSGYAYDNSPEYVSFSFSGGSASITATVASTAVACWAFGDGNDSYANISVDGILVATENLNYKDGMLFVSGLDYKKHLLTVSNTAHISGFAAIVAVPEPSSLCFAGASALALGLFGWRRKA